MTSTLAVNGNGQREGGTPDGDGPLPGDKNGIQGQFCCGANETVMVQDCPPTRENGDPGRVVQSSVSVKCGRPLKSLGPNGPLVVLKPSVSPFTVAPAGSLFVSVMVCVVGAEPRT